MKKINLFEPFNPVHNINLILFSSVAVHRLDNVRVPAKIFVNSVFKSEPTKYILPLLQEIYLLCIQLCARLGKGTFFISCVL